MYVCMYVCMYTMILPLHFSVPIYSPWQKKKKKKNTQKKKRGAGPLPGPEYQLQNRKGCRADPLSEVIRKRLKKSPQINCMQL